MHYMSVANTLDKCYFKIQQNKISYLLQSIAFLFPLILFIHFLRLIYDAKKKKSSGNEMLKMKERSNEVWWMLFDRSDVINQSTIGDEFWDVVWNN